MFSTRFVLYTHGTLRLSLLSIEQLQAHRMASPELYYLQYARAGAPPMHGLDCPHRPLCSARPSQPSGLPVSNPVLLSDLLCAHVTPFFLPVLSLEQP
jgi:hypothetical protein